MSVEHKAKGNAAFSSGDYDAAIQHFSAGIEVDPGNHVLYSNRSAAYASLKQYKEALTDAQKVVELKPDWPKGYSRLGAANSGLGAWDAAVEAYQKGVQLEPSNEGSKKALEDAIASRASTRSKGGVGGLFGPDFIGKLAMDSRTRPLMSDPEFQTMLREMQSDPMGSMQKYMKNPKFQTALSVGMGMNIFAGDKEDESMDNSEVVEPGQEATSRPPSSAQQQGSSTAKEPETAASAPSPKTEPEPMEVEEDEGQDQDSKAERENKVKAQKEKELGNAAYKARQFDEAIKHYDAAIDLDNTDISFLTNRAAVYFEKADYDRCIKDCDQAVERGRELRQDYKLIAKALTRKGNAQVKQEKLDDAILTYQKSLTEHRNADTLKRLNDTERKLKDQKEQAYIDLEQCEKERESGNQAFKEQKYAEAVKFYSEGLKRGPPSVNPEAYKLYSNRAACLTKLMAYPEGIKDCDQCIALKPDFAKGYSRKGTLQFLMKDYDKAIKTYEEGLEKADKDNEELKNGISQCLMTINKMRYGQATDEEIKQRQARGMQDPEVQRILTDPVMRQVLEDLQTDPKNSQHHLEHPQIRAKIDKLVSAGIVQLR